MQGLPHSTIEVGQRRRLKSLRVGRILTGLLFLYCILSLTLFFQDKESQPSDLSNSVHFQIQTPASSEPSEGTPSQDSSSKDTSPQETSISMPVKGEASISSTTSSGSSSSKAPQKFPRSFYVPNRSELSKEKILDIYGTSSFLQAGGTVIHVDSRHKLLCRMKITTNCFTNYVADSVDLAVAFSPLYVYNQEAQADLYIKHDYFTAMLLRIGIRTQVIEAIMPSRNQVYKRTTAGKEPWEIQITVEDSFFYRENLVNVAAKKTYDIWEYMFWIDAHQVFENIYWWEEAIVKLEHVSAVHLLDRASYYDDYNKTIWLSLPSVSYSHKYSAQLRGTYFFAGNGWAMRKEVYKKVGYIIDECVAGACDYSLMISLMDNNEVWDGITGFPFYFEQLKPIINAARKKLGKKFATIRGQIFHINHVHPFNYWSTQEEFRSCCIDMKKDMYRDENFTLHSSNAAFKAHFKAR